MSPVDRPVLTPLTEADFAPLAELARTIWHEHYRDLISAAQIDYMLAGRHAPAALARYLERTDAWMSLLRLDGQPIGYCSHARTPEAEEMKLQELYLSKAWRGRGWGNLMITHVAAHARTLGCRTLMLTVNKRNTGSIAVYRRAGFEVREEAVFDIGNGFLMDDYVMVKPLST